MAAFPPLVERWRATAIAVAPDLPVDLVLAYVQRESGGVPGRVAYADVRIPYTDAERACGLPAALARRCLGLMQVAPVTWRSYVASSGDTLTPCDLARTDVGAGAGQLRAGAYALRSALRFAGWRGEARPGDEVIRMSRLAYARGEPATAAKLAEARAKGYPATSAGIEQLDPLWGRPDRPFDGARAILARYKAAIGAGPLPVLVPPSEPGTGSGGAIVLLVILGLWLWHTFRGGQ